MNSDSRFMMDDENIFPTLALASASCDKDTLQAVVSTIVRYKYNWT